jgi:hypothetical protein
MATSYPQAVHDRARSLTETHGLCVAAEILGIHRCALWRMKSRDWKPGRPGRQRSRPTDFAIQHKHMTHEELRAHYKTSSKCVTRWRRELRESES